MEVGSWFEATMAEKKGCQECLPDVAGSFCMYGPIKRQRGMLAFGSLSYLPMGWCHQHSEWVFLPQLSLSGKLSQIWVKGCVLSDFKIFMIILPMKPNHYTFFHSFAYSCVLRVENIYSILTDITDSLCSDIQIGFPVCKLTYIFKSINNRLFMLSNLLNII